MSSELEILRTALRKLREDFRQTEDAIRILDSALAMISPVRRCSEDEMYAVSAYHSLEGSGDLSQAC